LDELYFITLYTGLKYFPHFSITQLPGELLLILRTSPRCPLPVEISHSAKCVQLQSWRGNHQHF